MAVFPGFGVSGYRTLSVAVQWIPLDAAVTVFLGGNNSGKSNILRLVHSHMGEQTWVLFTRSRSHVWKLIDDAQGRLKLVRVAP